VAESIASSTVA
jgi:5'-AMP-activated protein kinase catalytic alpha subunit